MASFTKREILEHIVDNTELTPAINYILKKLNVCEKNIASDSMDRLRKALFTLRSKRNSKYNAACRKVDYFESKNSSWLDSEFKVPDLVNVDNEKSTTTPGLGRPPVSFDEKSKRSKRREAAMISASVQHNPQKILMACRYAARRSGANDLCAILGKITDSPEMPSKIRKVLDSKTPQIIKKTAEQALVFLFDNSLSKNVYTNMRLESKACGADIWPPYNELRALKAECRPPKEIISIQETEAEVPIQFLLDHTSERLVKLQKKVILEAMQRMNYTVMDVVVLCSSGLDRSTGHSIYKQSYKSVHHEIDIQDNDLLATVLIPLQLITKDNMILWSNRASQSARFCRPIKLQYVKESVEIIIRQKKYIDQQIDNLQVFNIFVDENHCIRIHYAVFFTLIDGKVLNAITDTKSMQTCPICHATPKQFNDLSNKKEVFLPDSKSLVYGISPLHAWIRLLECCLHISYRIDVKVWQIRGDKLKVAFADRKKRVQAILWEKLGLIVDRPKPGGSGTTNDGNTARRAFKNPTLLAECLDLNSELLKNIQTILIALSSHMPIDPERFDVLCSRTAEIYVANYPWYPMPSTVHKILIHGADILRTSILPVGMFGEEASEARNKDYKNFRLFHSRKTSRKDTLRDLFYRVMDTSDPIISSNFAH